MTEYRGLNVAQQQQLRRSLRASGTEYKIVKMTLARLAAGELGIEGAEEWLTGPTALAFAGEDPVESPPRHCATSPVTTNNSWSRPASSVGRLLLPEQVSRLADVEPRPVLLAKLAGAFQAPLAQAAGLFSALTRNTASVVSQLLEKRAAREERRDGESGRRTQDACGERDGRTADGGRSRAEACRGGGGARGRPLRSLRLKPLSRWSRSRARGRGR